MKLGSTLLTAQVAAEHSSKNKKRLEENKKMLTSAEARKKHPFYSSGHANAFRAMEKIGTEIHSVGLHGKNKVSMYLEEQDKRGDSMAFLDGMAAGIRKELRELGYKNISARIRDSANCNREQICIHVEFEW